MKSELTGIKYLVEIILSDYPDTRNSDKKLISFLWTRFYPEIVRTDSDNLRKFIYLSDMLDLPSPESIRRARQVIQNTEKRLVPTSEGVAKKRRMNVDEWREALGYYNLNTP